MDIGEVARMHTAETAIRSSSTLIGADNVLGGIGILEGGGEDDNFSLARNSAAIDAANAYDTEFGTIYDWIACNPVYNRLIWGYSTKNFASLAQAALTSSKAGNVLDLGCGSLAFAAKTYIQYSDRPCILIDQSLKMLRLAKSRLIKFNGNVPDNMVFLHADALPLPFQQKSFKGCSNAYSIKG